ncbi:MAG: hypothetical protein K0R31_1355, partial [Clostridiales bacterium]|nr:hypothetical protein [Clostridiales bacterium]
IVRENFKEEMMRQSTRDQLNSAFFLSQENREIRNELSKLTEHKSLLAERVAAQADIITSLREKIETYKRKNKLTSDLQSENFELKQRIEEMQDKHIKQIKKLLDENFQTMIKMMQDK